MLSDMVIRECQASSSFLLCLSPASQSYPPQWGTGIRAPGEPGTASLCPVAIPAGRLMAGCCVAPTTDPGLSLLRDLMGSKERLDLQEPEGCP